MGRRLQKDPSTTRAVGRGSTPWYNKLPVSRNLLIFIVFSLTLGRTATIDVGSGAPNSGLTGRFVNAFYRNGFAYLVSLPPVDNVQRFAGAGLIQEFNAAGST